MAWICGPFRSVGFVDHPSPDSCERLITGNHGGLARFGVITAALPNPYPCGLRRRARLKALQQSHVDFGSVLRRQAKRLPGQVFNWYRPA